MSIPYEANGRVNQKQRTRAALIRAAQDLVAAGTTPTVEQTATAAGVSRAVGYRYFPNQRALLAAAHPETAATSLLPPTRRQTLPSGWLTSSANSPASSPAPRQQQRTMLRLSLTADNASRATLPLRQGRAIAWISEALAPLRGQLTDQQLHHLALAIRSAIGIEALSWQTDVAHLTRDESVALMSWTAQALLHAATTWKPPDLEDPADR